MLYVDFPVNGKEYKLRLNTRNVVALEKSLGMNPLSIFGDGSELPTVTTMVTVLHASLQAYQHGITVDDAYDIFDKWLADGNSVTNFISVIIELYKVSGLINSKDVEEDNGKN